MILLIYLPTSVVVQAKPMLRVSRLPLLGETRFSEAALGMPPGLRHGFLITSRQRRVDAVRRLMAAMDLQHVLVFMNFQNRLKDTMFKLAARGMQVVSPSLISHILSICILSMSFIPKALQWEA